MRVGVGVRVRVGSRARARARVRVEKSAAVTWVNSSRTNEKFLLLSSY